MLREAKFLDLTPSKGEAASPRGHSAVAALGLLALTSNSSCWMTSRPSFIRQANGEPTLADPLRLPLASGQVPYPQLLAIISLPIIF